MSVPVLAGDRGFRMTDLIARSDAEQATGEPATPQPEAQWAPAEPSGKKHRLGLWIGIPAGVVVLGAAAASLFLVAPGTTIGGVHVGFLTPGAAADAVQAHVEATSVVIGEGGPTLTASELGASVDAPALASAAFEQRPLWNVTQWFGEPIEAPLALDADAATIALRDAAPQLYADPTPASISFDGAAYVVSPAVDGEGVDLAAIAAPLQRAVEAGQAAATIPATPAVISSPTTTELAQKTADALNAMLPQLGFYVGDERTVPVDAATAASWITVTTAADGSLSYTADAAKIQGFVDGLAPLVNRDPVAGTVIKNSSGDVIETVTASVDGRVLGDTSGVAKAFADQLARGEARYELPVETTAAPVTAIERLLEIDLSSQKLYMWENGSLVDSFLISSGLPGADTPTGDFRVYAHVRSQTMSGWQTALQYNYEIPNVEYVMYFDAAGDNAFHGVYWRDNWGERGSNGCIGMPNWRAEQIYYWSPDGIDVTIHD